jgi:nitrate reductase gamma subunit
MNALNTVLFVAFPYVAVIVCVVGVAYRYRQKGFTVSSLSSQFLEGRRLFWGAVPFHLGLLAVLLLHLAAWLFPGALLAWSRSPARLVALEITTFAFALSVVLGLAVLLSRRLTNHRVRAVTSGADVAVVLLLLAQVGLGAWIALRYRWGASWFAADLAPYLWSLVKLDPETAAVFALPWPIKLHVAGAFVLVLLVPFTRLVHFIVAPLHYLARPYQQVIWNWDRRKIRNPATPWTPVRPRNN